MRRLTVALAIAAVILTCAAAQQKKRSHAKTSTQKNGASATAQPSLDQQRFEFEKQKYQSDHELELQKLQLQREQLQQSESASHWSQITGVIPLLLTLATLCFSIWSFQRQAKQQANTQLEAAKLQFQLKVAEIVFAAKSPEAAANKAKSLVIMFPDRLPTDFAKGFDPSIVGGGKEDPEGKKVFLESILKYPGNDAKVFDLWKEMFGDDWLVRVEPVVQHYAAQPAQPTQTAPAPQPTQVNVAGTVTLQQAPSQPATGTKPPQPGTTASGGP